MLVDPATGAPVPKNIEVARTAEEVGVELQLELTSCQVETSTGVHGDTADLLKELGQLRRQVADCAARNDARLLAVAVPPAVPEQFPVTDTPRYQRIAREFGMIAREQGLSGCHVHVAVPDRDVAVQVSNYLRPWLPVYLALTANSSVYRGAETGYASWRSILWRRWPSAGPPPYFDSLADFDAMVDMMLSSGSILDRKMVYWDVRPSESFPTVEVRVSDVPATVAETALLATLVRATAMTAMAAIDDGQPAPEVPAEVLRAAYWNAARSGLDGAGLDPLTRRVAPVRTLVAGLVDYTRPALDELGATAFVDDTLAAVLHRGNGARRQLAALRKRNEITDVTTELANATLEGCS
ncbi:carboxylate-amine ligase [Nocardia tenerifensis]|uniref:Putative glutamate--cysteine ligase 2 n=1 Tax=Nocardia tenerifensis TaxID=228006 RepID=A0A318KBL6_9NOCA|nr:carboxylate-amine ligase [Nocardia tenerifensis]